MVSVMAKLVAVVRSDDYKYGKRQMPLNVEDKLTMVLQFPDVCLQCGVGTTNRTRADLDRFTQRFTSMDTNQRMASTSTNQEEIANQIAALIPCVGCRKSVERLLDHLTLTGNSALDPLIFTKKGNLEQITLRKVFREEPHVLFAMFYTHGDRLKDFLDSIPRSKKNKRCHLHSLDTQKTKSTTNWVDLWSLLSEECKEEVLMIDYQKFMEAMIVYLDKHRFCIDCKTKVLHAHGLLIGDDCKKKDKGFNAALYDGIDYCKNAKHVHIRNDTEFIAHLIARAEPDLLGRRERHAKTMEIAQEEVLTCLGSYLYVRFNRLLQKIRLEEQTWRQLFYIITCCLRQNYEMEYEKKLGVSQLELFFTELESEQRSKEHKKEMKRKKKKKSKQDKKLLTSAAKQTFTQRMCQSCVGGDGESECSQCLLESQLQSPTTATNSTAVDACACKSSNVTASSRSVSADQMCTCDTADTESIASYNQSPLHVPAHLLSEDGGVGETSPVVAARQLPYCTVKTSSSDLGYSSGPEGCDSCSHASSNSTDGAGSMLDIAYCDRHNPGMSSLDHSCEGMTCECGLSSNVTTSQRNAQQIPFRSTLQDMLEMCSDEDEEENGQLISEADMAVYRANMPSMNEERLQLREKLRQQFDRMQKQRQHSKATCSKCSH